MSFPSSLVDHLSLVNVPALDREAEERPHPSSNGYCRSIQQRTLRILGCYLNLVFELGFLAHVCIRKLERAHHSVKTIS